LRRFVVPDMLCPVTRQFIALILMLAIGLEGSSAAFAATAPVSIDCQTKAHSGAAQNSCCPNGQRPVSCCLDLCLLTVGATVSQVVPTWFIPPSESMVATPAIFSSRGDSPLIRPPIVQV
jgi:hypothetical protein